VTPLDALIQRVIVREGGVADVGDGKGVTRWGQTPAWLAQYDLPVPQNTVDAATNYAKWVTLVGLLPIVSPGDSLADVVLDMAVMSGVSKAVKTLQAALGVVVDGAIGPQTLSALSMAGRGKIAREVIASDIEYEGSLITLDPSRARFAKGWASRIAGHVRRLA
jgi:lysozyme family protein